MLVLTSLSYLFTACIASPVPSTPSPIPLSNTTALDTEVTGEWYPSSSTRGTGDLLYSCALTLSLCVYTAIHLNIPAPDESAWKQTLRKAKWVLIGIFAPEIVLYTALQQWLSARRLLHALNRMNYKLKNGKPDMTYCFYAIMGGFALDVSELHDEYKYLTLTTEGVQYLAEKGHLMGISGVSIKDKSKADSLAKVLVCLQMTWLIVQCVVRKVYGYPISLLELHTFVHAICALLMYVLWINKPQDVRDPTIVDTSQYEDLVAQALMVSMPFSPARRMQDENGLSQVYPGRSTEINFWTVYNTTNPHPALPNISNLITIGTASGTRAIKSVGSRNPFRRDSQGDIGLIYLEHPHGWGPQTVRAYDRRGRETPIPLEMSLTKKHIRRLDLALGGGTNHFKEGEADRDGLASGLCLRSQNLIFEDIEGAAENIYFLLSMVILMLIYGGVHLAAWTFRFPSKVEAFLWTASCLDLIGMAGVVALLWFAITRGDDGWIHSSGVYGWVLLVVNVIIYIFSRVFIVVEAFLSLRRVPVGVYAVIPWSNLIPHF
ncbi:hypothetical protein BDZ45DRAFT_612349 [Acephala macrosclerotiorum]|nr:hypothetical protein BDZ45DRAFT_612349 [Acephala macrosclerotiorum]